MKKKLFDNIILTENHAWHITQSGWKLKNYFFYIQQLSNNTILSHALFRKAQYCNVMFRFMVQALQDPPLCSSTV
jgi:hypothetical protein